MTQTHRSPIADFRNEPPPDFSRDEVRDGFREALAAARDSFPVAIPMVIGGRRVETKETIQSLDPSDNSRVVAVSASASAADADRAVEAARKAFPAWSRTPAETRAEILLRAAAIMRDRRDLLSAVAVFEAGKPWREAAADTDEAIDFLEFYAREMLRLAHPRRLQQYLLGERNDLSYHALGVVAVIGPWNFPIAIPVGMAAAALVAGNTVVLKPAEQTPLCTWMYMQALEEAGLPPGAMNFLPGRGEVCGDRIVRHREVNMVVFTGSRDVGLLITRAASEVPPGQRFVKRVVTEMGGKNGLIVDSSADLDSAVPDVIYSAFGFSGQKCSACSRAIVLKDVYEEFLARLKEGVAALKIGPAEHPGTQVGPVIDAEAAAKVRSYIELGTSSAKAIHIGDLHGLEQKGSFVPPAVFDVPNERHRLMQEEIFGPVLAVVPARDFGHALEIANSTDYALTGGVHSRTLTHLRRARAEYEAGNLYLNRPITGAIVGRQPFGGYRLSGVGSKAGGPDYLKQFLVARVASENLMRHGVASLSEEDVLPHGDD